MFQLLQDANTPTVIGKAWWNEALKLSQTGDGRRVVLGAAAFIGAIMVVPPVCGLVMAGSDDDDDGTRQERRAALKAQQEFGWSFGATNEVNSLGTGLGPPSSSSPADIDRLMSILQPKNPRWQPLWNPTLFQSLTARPTSTMVPEDVRDSGFRPLRDVVQPSLPPTSMSTSNEGFFLLSAIKDLLGAGIVVDLAGPDATAYACAVADRFDPVFLFDNWPHPRGVVKAHETLAAALALAPEFERKKQARPVEAPPCFVLDRTRLAPYTDDASQFDNRSLARLPSADKLLAAGVKNVFYVAPNVSPVDMDDVVDDLVAWKAAGVTVRAVVVDSHADPVTPSRIGTFLAAHGLPVPKDAIATNLPVAGATYTPTPRSTPFAAHQHPTGFGEVPVVVSVGTGVLLGAVLYRNGSWNRAPVSSSYFGGG